MLRQRYTKIPHEQKERPTRRRRRSSAILVLFYFIWFGDSSRVYSLELQVLVWNRKRGNRRTFLGEFETTRPTKWKERATKCWEGEARGEEMLALPSRDGSRSVERLTTTGIIYLEMETLCLLGIIVVLNVEPERHPPTNSWTTIRRGGNIVSYEHPI